MISGLILGVLMVLVVPLILRIFPDKEIGPVEKVADEAGKK